MPEDMMRLHALADRYQVDIEILLTGDQVTHRATVKEFPKLRVDADTEANARYFMHILIEAQIEESSVTCTFLPEPMLQPDITMVLP